MHTVCKTSARWTWCELHALRSAACCQSTHFDLATVILRCLNMCELRFGEERDSLLSIKSCPPERCQRRSNVFASQPGTGDHEGSSLNGSSGPVLILFPPGADVVTVSEFDSDDFQLLWRVSDCEVSSRCWPILSVPDESAHKHCSRRSFLLLWVP